MLAVRQEETISHRLATIVQLLRLLSIRHRRLRTWSGDRPDNIGPGLFTGWMGPAAQLAMLLRNKQLSLFSGVYRE
jgi:hypothetical protein